VDALTARVESSHAAVALALDMLRAEVRGFAHTASLWSWASRGAHGPVPAGVVVVRVGGQDIPADVVVDRLEAAVDAAAPAAQAEARKARELAHTGSRWTADGILIR